MAASRQVKDALRCKITPERCTATMQDKYENFFF